VFVVFEIFILVAAISSPVVMVVYPSIVFEVGQWGYGSLWSVRLLLVSIRCSWSAEVEVSPER
jgi:hypothetical protein